MDWRSMGRWASQTSPVLTYQSTRRGEGLFLAISEMTSVWKYQPEAQGSEEAKVQENKRSAQEETLALTIIIIRAV